MSGIWHSRVWHWQPWHASSGHGVACITKVFCCSMWSPSTTGLAEPLGACNSAGSWDSAWTVPGADTDCSGLHTHTRAWLSWVQPCRHLHSATFAGATPSGGSQSTRQLRTASASYTCILMHFLSSLVLPAQALCKASLQPSHQASQPSHLPLASHPPSSTG